MVKQGKQGKQSRKYILEERCDRLHGGLGVSRRTSRPMDLQTQGPPDPWTSRPMDPQTHREPPDPRRTSRQLDL
ncbi:hypothetical protein NHX12_009340 [Muraenolepis orangiensis]|uniref:Uncharacterized protein n=1 Tax=Muraenolepis orangiensis TaxID=630683 RepID=A0A9Q0DQL5_9TELE|nr:hypothetical protein NHX12_009340 [Muraenolepis orangiensis]